jgi:hypothetical protein
MEDRYGVSRSGAYVENVRSWLDPWKEILAGMRMLLYHRVGGTVKSRGTEHAGKISQERSVF